MIAKLRHTVWQATALMVLLLAFASCSSGAGPFIEEPETEITLGFYVTAGDKVETSRATPSGDYDPGAGLENHIDISGGDIKVLIFSIDNEFLVEIKDFIITPLESYASSKRYYIKAKISTDISGKQFKIVVAANWGNYPETWNFDNIFAAEYKYVPGPLTEDNLIPLYGVKTFAVESDIKPETVVELGTIHLLRAMAKVEVVYATDKIYSVSSVRMLNYNTTGFCAPNNVKTENDYVHGSWDLDYVPYPSIPASAEISSETDFIPTTSGNWIIYVPEYNNKSNSIKASVEVTLVDDLGKSEVHIINFTDVNMPRDLLRNYWYRLNLKKAEGRLLVEVDVLPYRVIELNPDFGLDVPDVVAPTLRQQWRSHQGFTADVRSGNGFGGKVYLVDGNEIRTYDGEKVETIFTNEGAMNKGLFVDEAGNMLINRNWPTDARNWNLFTLISADLQTVKDVTVNKPVNSAWTGSRSDMNGRAIGDFFSEKGGLCYLTANTQTSPIPVWIKNGELQTVEYGTGAEFFAANTTTYAQPAVETMESIDEDNVANSFYYYTGNDTWNIGYVNEDGDAAYLTKPAADALPENWAPQSQNGFDVVVLGGKKYIFRMADTGTWGANFIVHDEEGNIVATSGYNNASGWGSIGTAGYGSGIFVRKVSETKAEVYQIFKGVLDASFSAMYIFEVP